MKTINHTLVPQKDLTTEQVALMLLLNREVINLSGHKRPIFNFNPELNRGNINLIQLLRGNPLIPVAYDFDHLIDYDHNQELWLNVRLRMTFHTQPSDFNLDESNWNILYVTPKQTSLIVTTIENLLLQSRFQEYALALAQSIKESAGRVESFVQKGISLDSARRGNNHPVLDSRNDFIYACCYTTQTLLGERMAWTEFGENVRKFGR